MNFFGQNSPWTAERDAELRRLWETTLSASEIGKAMGLSKNQVVGRAHRLKLPPRENALAKNFRLKGVAEKRERERRLAAAESAKAAQRSTAPLSPAPLAPRPSFCGAAGPKNAPRQMDRRKRLEPLPMAQRRGPGCQWIEDEPSADDACKCGRPRTPARPYCRAHDKRAWTPRVHGRRGEDGP